MMSLSVTDISYDEIYDQIKKLLPQGTGEIKDTDNLIESGLDSLHIMRLVSQWRKSGYNITFAELIEHPTLQQWQTLLLKSFSEISSVTSSATAIDQVKNEPFPLTDVQYAYWIGRDDNRELGGVACHAYLEIDGHLNHPEQLNLAFSQLIQHHPMLRASFTDNGQQQIKAANNNAPLIVHDLRELTAEQCTQRLAEIRKRLSHRKLAIEHGQVIGLELSLLANSKSRLHFDIDLLVADVQSLNIILRDLAQLYRQELPLKAPNDWNFAHYLVKEQQRKQANYQTSKNYWNQRLTELPVGPQLPVLSKQITKPEFTRRTFVLNHNQWQNLKQQAAKHKITPAMTLACAYGYVLARWSNHTNFLLNIPLFDRNVEELDIEYVVADFTNLLLLDCDYSQSHSFAEQAIQLQQQFHKNVAYSTYSAIEIQREMARFNNQQGIIAPVVFACNLGTPLLDMATSQTLGELHYMISQTPQVWLDHQVYEINDGLLLAWDSVEELFPNGLMDVMFDAYCQLLIALSEDSNAWQQSPFQVLPTAQQLIRKQVNTVTAPLPSTTLIEPIFAYAKANPTSIALIYNEQEISYKELTTQALKIANLLVSKGLKTGEPVAVSLPRGPMQIMAVLGVLAAGGAYVPVSTTQPTSRQQKIFNTAEIRLVLCNQPLFEDSQFEFISPLLAMDLKPLAEPVKVDNKSLAYIIFTSGSTGEPKGVEISHQAALNTIVDICQRYHIDNSSCALAVSSLDFDLSVFDIFGLLGVGGRLVLISDEERRDAASWLQLIFEHDVCVWNSVPILLDMLLVVATHDTRTLPLKTVLLSGDWIGLDLPVRLAQCCGKLPKLVAMGGATEGSIWSNAFDVTLPLPEQWSSIPYGYPLTNQCYRVVDALGRDCPDYVAGELWIGGAGVALGYRGAPELTAERFVELNGMRWYRTGDRGRYWPDGTLEFLGRQDHQVKVRGHRIELGEIESALAGLPEIARAVAVTVGMPPQLAAAIQLKQGVTTTEHDIKQLLQQLLPDYMVPTSLVIYQDLPLNANGKVDRKTIISELANQINNTETIFEAPQTIIEQQVAQVWQTILKVDQVGRTDNFFALGGDSLLATQVISHLKQLGLDTEQPLRQLFAKPKLADFAATLTQTEQKIEQQVVADLKNRYQPFPLTEVQRAYWMGQAPGLPLNCGTHYLVELDGTNVDLAKFNQAWNQLVRYHEMMRVTIDTDGNQTILQHAVPVALYTISLNTNSAAKAQQIIHDYWQQQRLAKNYNHHLYAIKYGQQRCRIGIIFNYLTLDGFSIKLILQQLAMLYENSNATLPDLDLSFRDFVTQIETDNRTKNNDKTFWLEKLNTLPLAPQLPIAKQPEQLNQVIFKRYSHRLSANQWSQLKSKARQHQLTPSVILLTAYAHILAQWSANQPLSINLTLFDRPDIHPQINQIAGDFTTLAPVGYYPNSAHSVIEQAKAMQQEIVDALEHKTISSIWIQRERSKTMGMATAALPVVFTSTLGLGQDLFVTQNQSFPAFVSGGLSETPQVWLDHQLYEFDGELDLSWDAVEELFPIGMLDQMFNSYIQLLNQFIEQDWQQPIVTLLPTAQQFIRKQVNTVTAPLPSTTLIEPIFAYAKANPTSIALIYNEQEISYKELTTQALKIANLLVSKGLKTGEPVAVSLPRGPMQIMAVLGVLAAGGAYVPVSTTQPTSRQQKIFNTAEIRLVLCNQPLFEDSQFEFISPLLAMDLKPLAEPVKVDNKSLAYIIFTSGSTGEPKGVEISHQAALNTIVDICQRYHIDNSSCALAVSSLDFDLSVFDIFGLLGVGGRLVLISDEERRDAASWLQLIFEHDVCVWNSVPILLDMLLVVATHDTRTLPLKTVLLSGDWIGLDLPVRLAQCCGKLPKLVAMGGATEGSIWSNAFDVTLPLPEQWSSIPYGYPLTNQCYRVVDALGRDCPDYVAGELWIGGAGVALGYRGAPELTAERFVELNGMRWYRTGDRGRYWPDGTLEFLGRQDHQVKVRGHRIELGEIESALAGLPEIARAVAVTVGMPPQLAAAIQLKQGVTTTEHDIKQLLQQLLPDYMVPTSLVIYQDLPLNANGKVDRKTIISELANQINNTETIFEAPQTIIEQQVAQVWQTILKVDQVGRTDNFFALGGDSLLATQVISHLKQLGLDTEQPLRQLFAKPKLADFAATLTQTEQKIEQQVVADLKNRYQPFPLTEVQRAYWMGQAPGLPLNCGTHYLVELDGERIDLQRLTVAWNKLVERHDMLHTIVTQQAEQQILPEWPVYTIAQTQHDNLLEVKKSVAEWWQQQQNEKYSLPFAIHSFNYSDNRNYLAIIFNYMNLDGFSIKLVLKELADFYQNPDLQLPKLTLSFRDYVTQVNYSTDALQRAEAYWRNRMATLPAAPPLPVRIDPQQIKQSKFIRKTAKLNHQTFAALCNIAKNHSLTPSVIIMLIYAEVLSQYSGGQAITINMTLFDRQPVHPEIYQITGDFTSLLPIAYAPDATKSLLNQAQYLQEELATALDHREISSIWVQRELARNKGINSGSLPIVFTSTLGIADELLQDSEQQEFLQLTGSGLSETPQVWLDHQLYQLEGGLLLSWDAVEDLFPEGLLDQMFNSYIQLLNQFIEQDWQQPIVTLLPTAQQFIRKQVNTVTAPLPSTTLIEPIFAYAKANPTSIALIYNEQEISYKELTTQALKIANLLVSKGLKTGEPVAVSLPRGPMQIMAVLGVLAAGGAYVPVSTTQPTSRQQKIFNTAEIRLVLCNQPLFEDSQFEFISPLLAMDLKPLAEPVKVDNKSLAYIIFTSGSTGEPKGVEISHQAALNTIVDICQRYHIDNSSCALAVSSLDFDLSVFDIFGLLGVGGRLVLISDEERRDAASWLQLIFEHDVCVWNSVPILLDMLLVVATHDTRTLPLKTVLLSGDWIGLDLPVRLAQCCGKLPKLVAMGGATEGSIWSNAFDVTLPLPEQWSSIPYGYPLTNQCYRVVDALGRDCPDYVAGELWIGGAGVALGYRGAPELTAERFVELNGMRWYRTGDRGRYWPDGTLEFLGRQDHQVKVRGHRIELGEIESALAGLPEIARAVAVTVGMPPQLAAAIQLKQGVTTTEHDIKQLLQQLLPDYMVPTSLVIYQDLPLNANGKVDRKTIISELATHTTNVVDKEPPRDELERQLAELWQEVLKCPALSRDDDFFLSGGDSLTATQIIQLLHKRHITSELIPLRALFTAPTVASLSDYIKQQWQTHSSIAINESTLFEEGTL